MCHACETACVQCVCAVCLLYVLTFGSMQLRYCWCQPLYFIKAIFSDQQPTNTPDGLGFAFSLSSRHVYQLFAEDLSTLHTKGWVLRKRSCICRTIIHCLEGQWPVLEVRRLTNVSNAGQEPEHEAASSMSKWDMYQ